MENFNQKLINNLRMTADILERGVGDINPYHLYLANSHLEMFLKTLANQDKLF